MIKVQPITIQWDSSLPIFAREEFLRAVGDEYGWLGGVDECGALRCVLPYTIVHRAGLRLVRFRVETIVVAGPIAAQEEQAFLDSVVAHFKAAGAHIIIPPTTNTVFRVYPRGALAAPYCTYLVDLQQSEDQLWSGVHPKNRTAIRNAIKRGVKVRSGLDYADAAYVLVRDTFKRSGLSFMEPAAFRRMLAGLGDKVTIVVAEHQGELQGCAVLPYSDYSAYSVYAGSIERPTDGATKLLHWDAMKMFRESGVQRYDFVGARVDPERGSKQEQLMLYKRHLGGQPHVGYTWKCSLRPLGALVYSLGVRLLRGGDIVDQEAHKLKGAQQ